jgi:hypothetical protein
MVPPWCPPFKGGLARHFASDWSPNRGIQSRRKPPQEATSETISGGLLEHIDFERKNGVAFLAPLRIATNIRASGVSTLRTDTQAGALERPDPAPTLEPGLVKPKHTITNSNNSLPYIPELATAGILPASKGSGNLSFCWVWVSPDKESSASCRICRGDLLPVQPARAQGQLATPGGWGAETVDIGAPEPPGRSSKAMHKSAASASSVLPRDSEK